MFQIPIPTGIEMSYLMALVIVYFSMALIPISLLIIVMIIKREIFYMIFRIPYRIIWLDTSNRIKRFIVKDSKISKGTVKIKYGKESLRFDLDDKKAKLTGSKLTYFFNHSSPLTQQLLTNDKHDRYDAKAFEELFKSKVIQDAFHKDIDKTSILSLLVSILAIVIIFGLYGYVMGLQESLNQVQEQLGQLLTRIQPPAPPPPT